MHLRTSLLTISATSATLALVLALTACNDDGPPTNEESSETGDGDGDPSTGDGDGDPTTGDGDGDGDPTTGDGDGDPTTGDGDGDPGCVDAGDAYAHFSILEFDPGTKQEWDLTCKSGGVVASGESGYDILLTNCSADLNPQMPPSELTLNVDSSPATMPFINVDAGVQLHWVQYPPFIPGKWFTLFDESGTTLLLAGVDGPSVLPSDTPEFNYGPLGVNLVSIGCEPFEHESQCGLAERQAFEVMWDGDTATVADGTSDFVGQLVSYEVVVGEALDFPELACDDFPSKILQALFFMIPEG